MKLKIIKIIKKSRYHLIFLKRCRTVQSLTTDDLTIVSRDVDPHGILRAVQGQMFCLNFSNSVGIFFLLNVLQAAGCLKSSAEPSKF